MAVVKRTAEPTGLSEKTIRTIHTESISCDGQLLTPLKSYMVSRIRVNPDAFDREAIRWLVHGFYTRREYPILNGVVEKAKEECGFPGGRFCLLQLFQQLGFTYKNVTIRSIFTNRQTYWNKNRNTYKLFTNYNKTIHLLSTLTRYG